MSAEYDAETLPVHGGVELVSSDAPFGAVRRTSYRSTQASLASYEFQEGGAFPMHSHEEEQITVICEGEVEFLVAGQRHRLTAGETFVVAPGVEHSLRAGPGGARFLAIVVPPRSTPNAYTIHGPADGPG